jgi:hypothetical protein
MVLLLQITYDGTAGIDRAHSVRGRRGTGVAHEPRTGSPVTGGPL